MKCLLKYPWVKLPRNKVPGGKGLMGAWMRLAARAAFRKGEGHYCGYDNPVVPGMWVGGIVGLKAILGLRRRDAAQTAPAEEKIDFSNVEIEPLFKDFVDFETFSKSDFRAVKVLNCEAVPKSKKLLKFTLDDGTGENRTILSGIHAYYEPEQLVGKTCVAITNLPPRPMMGIESCGMLLSALHKENGEERLNLLMLDPHIPAGAKLY